METTRKPYLSDVSDAEWAFVVPYLTLLPLDAEQRTHDLREVFNALRWLVRAGAPWRLLPNDLPPWAAVYQQTQRWIAAGSFEAIVHDLGRCCASRKGARNSPRPRSSMGGRCNRRPRAGRGPATTATSARKDRRFTRRWTRWVIS
jgi:transposase